MYNRIQKQYKKLNQSIQKAMQTGRFYAYTKFKQQQLLSRLKRSSLQLKQLGTGVALVTALGLTTAAEAQYPYILTEKTGIDNPVDSLLTGFYSSTFVDINGDGDLDIFASAYQFGSVTKFLENTGSPTNPVFVERTGSSNPFYLQSGLQGYDFVDIDGDGDLDCFAGNVNYLHYINSFYYENTGTATNPIFNLQSATNNPLDSVRVHLLQLNQGHQSTELEPHFSFADLDSDGDMDCFVTINAYHNNPMTEHLWYYENVGTATVPDFIRRSAADNPFNTVLSYYTSNIFFAMSEKITFADTDQDGDMDAVLHIVGVPSVDWWVFCENKGTAMLPDFDTVSVSPIDMASANGDVQFASLVDINNDSKLDVFRTSTAGYISDPIYAGSDQVQFFLNETPTNVSSLETQAARLHTFPNPTSGLLFFEKQVTGVLSVTSMTGQELMTTVLSNENQVNLSAIPSGMYTLNLKLEDDTIFSKVIFIKD